MNKYLVKWKPITLAVGIAVCALLVAPNVGSADSSRASTKPNTTSAVVVTPTVTQAAVTNPDSEVLAGPLKAQVTPPHPSPKSYKLLKVNQLSLSLTGNRNSIIWEIIII